MAQIRPQLQAGDHLYTVRDRVPEKLANYVRLAPLFGLTHVLEDGKTARELPLQ